MPMLCKPVTVRKCCNLLVFLMVLLLLNVKGYTQWALQGPHTVNLNEPTTYIPTYNGSSDYPFCGQYTYTITGGYLTYQGGTYLQAYNDCEGSALLDDIQMTVTWTSNSGTLQLWAGTGYMSISVTVLNPGPERAKRELMDRRIVRPCQGRTVF